MPEEDSAGWCDIVRRDGRACAPRRPGPISSSPEAVLLDEHVPDAGGPRAESEDLLRLAVEGADLGTFDYYPHTGELRWSDRCRAMFGLAPDAHVDYDVFLAGLHPEDRERAHAEVARALDPAGSGALRMEYRTIGVEDGTERWIAAAGRTSFDAERRPTRLVGTVLVVTARKRADIELSERAQQAALGSAIGRALTSVDPLPARLQRCAEVLVDHLGAAFVRVWALNEVQQVLELRASAGMYTHLDGPHGRVPVGAYKIGSIAQERRPHITNRVLGDPRVADQAWARREGMVAFAGYPLIVGGQLAGVLGLFARHELSERALDALASVSDGIAVAVIQARAERERDERAEQLAAANRELEAFSYSVSHDLRAPLRAIDGFSRILLEEHADAMPPEAQRYLGLVRDNARQMGELVDDLLAFSRLGRQALERRPVEPDRLARETWQDLRHDWDGRAVELHIGGMPPAYGDPSLLRQVYANLFGNALKFSRERAPAVIEVGAERHDDGVAYFVRDNGVGFDMKYADKLFGVFQRLHRAEEYEGTGVGLAIVQRIVQRHGGRVWATAALGEGAAFFFTLGSSSSEDVPEPTEDGPTVSDGDS